MGLSIDISSATGKNGQSPFARWFETLESVADAGKAILRDYINATITFELLSKFMEKSPESIMRMLLVKALIASDNIYETIHRTAMTSMFNLKNIF